MKRFNVIATALVVLGIAGAALAQNPPAQQQPAQPPARPQQPAATRPAAAEPSVTGTVTKLDPATRMLTLTTARNQQENIEIGPKATIQEGTRTLTVNELAKMVGRQVTVRYMESGGKKTASSITLMTTQQQQQPQPPATTPPSSTPPPQQPRPRP